MNNRDKVFTRLDAKGNRIPGSSVQRKVMPRVGSWVEDDPVNKCCFPYTLLNATPAASTGTSFTVTVLCDAVAKLTVVTSTAVATVTLQDIVNLLNLNLGYIGQFSVNGSTVDFKLKQEVSTGFLCSGTLTYTIV